MFPIYIFQRIFVDFREYVAKHQANQKYGEYPYLYHLDQVDKIVIANFNKKFGNPTNSETFAHYWILRIVAIGHDILEDCPWIKEEDLYNFFFRYVTAEEEEYAVKVILAAIVALTKKEKGKESYVDYFLRVLNNKYAVDVKIADLTHNLSTCPPGSRKDKYQLTLYILQNNGIHI